MLLVLEATTAGPQQISWAASVTLKLHPRQAVSKRNLDGMGLYLWTSAKGLGGDGSPLRLHPVVSSLLQVLEQGSGYGQANVSFAAASLEK